MQRAAARAYTNIALVKYWGKCDATWNLPAVPSLSLTLGEMSTHTEIELPDGLQADVLVLNGQEVQGEALMRVSAQLDRVAPLGKQRARARVVSVNNFPTASGLASSASAFAALTVAACAVWQRSMSKRDVSVLARQGSGSAARSIHGGVVLLGAGTPGQADSSFASPLCSAGDWSTLRLLVGVVGAGPKSVSSTLAMNQTSRYSPFFSAFAQGASQHIHDGVTAVAQRDLAALGQVAERSAMQMHAAMWGAALPVVYFQPPTLAAWHAVQQLRAAGIPAWFTCDAGPHPKVLTDAANAQAVEATLRSLPGIQQVIVGTPGGEAFLLEGGHHG